MYRYPDHGHVVVPQSVTAKILGKGRPRNIGIDPHALPIVIALAQRGWISWGSDGGHLNTRDKIEPVRVNLENATEPEIKQLAVSIYETAKRQQEEVENRATFAVEDVKTMTGKPKGLLFFHKTVQLFEAFDMHESETTYVEDAECRDDNPEWQVVYPKYITPEVLLEWNKVIMVTQVTVALLSLPMKEDLLKLV